MELSPTKSTRNSNIPAKILKKNAGMYIKELTFI